MGSDGGMNERKMSREKIVLYVCKVQQPNGICQHELLIPGSSEGLGE